MNRDQRQDQAIRLGRGRLLSGRTFASLVRAVTARTPVFIWARGRLAALAVTVLLAFWAGDGLIDLALSGSAGRIESLGLVGDGGAEGSGEDSSAGLTGQGQGLRQDLFAVPRSRQQEQPRAPKTNPVELLRLIQLQGVLGGAHPRAMVLYKQTKETVTVSVGDDLGEFQVVEIRERSVVLKWRDELFEISL